MDGQTALALALASALTHFTLRNSHHRTKQHPMDGYNAPRPHCINNKHPIPGYCYLSTCHLCPAFHFSLLLSECRHSPATFNQGQRALTSLTSALDFLGESCPSSMPTAIKFASIIISNEAHADQRIVHCVVVSR